MSEQGFVTTVIEAKGFGFIRTQQSGDVFFHCSDVADGLQFDERLIELPVVFDVLQSDRGPRAMNVRAAH